MRRLILPAFLLAASCSAETPTAPAPPPAEPAVEKPQPPPTAADQGQPTSYRALVPSPLDIEAQVKEAGLTDGLAGLVPERVFSPTATDLDATAVRTGVVLADAILAGKDAPREMLLERLGVIRSGMQAIGAGAGLLSSIDDLKASIEKEDAGKQEFIQALDDVASMMVPEEGWGPEDRTGPLLQAGAWLEGSNLVARAVLASGDSAAASKLLREKEVVDFFLRYVQDKGADKADAAVAETLAQVLATLSELAAKPELSLDDVRVIEAQTGQVLSLL